MIPKNLSASWHQHRRAWLLALIATAALIAAVVVALVLHQRGGARQTGSRQRDGMGGPIPVVAVAATKGDIKVYLNALGTVTSRNSVTVKSRIDGQLMRLDFREGQTVKSGQLLAEIDARPYTVQLAQANGQLLRDQAQLTNAELDLERYKTLLAQDSISKQQADTQEALVRQYRGTVAMDQGNVDNAKLQLTYTRIAAPVAGRVGLRQVDPGNMIHAADTNGIVTITQLAPITVLFSLPEDSVPRIMQRLGAGQALAAEAYDRQLQTRLASGRLLTLDNQIDTTTGTVKLRAEFANDDSALFPNQFVNVRLLVDTLHDATLVPSAAIQRGRDDMIFVYVVGADGRIAVRRVKLGPVEGETSAIVNGLAPGEMVVSEGSDKLREGAQVQVQKSFAAPTPQDNPNRRQWPKDGSHRRRQQAE